MAPTQRRPAARRQNSHRSQRSQRKRRRFRAVHLAWLGSAAIAILLLWAAIARNTAPHANTSRQSFDAVIILGVPADSDGNPTPMMLDRVNEGIREYERGIAPRLIFTGGAAHNQFVEAATMARVARSRGVPASAILEETHALDTIQNLCYSSQILAQRGLHSAEIVSNTSHLPRAALIAANLPHDRAFEWRTHSAAGNLTSGAMETAAGFVELLKTARYLVWARWTESCPA
jgi:uncharacterized SAM-binding protein YcdF (DUF218 family)